jgi:hypothetical protein
MTNDLINTRILRLAAFAVAMAWAPAVVSVPAAAKDQTISKSELKHLIATAETKADHERIAQYFDAQAAKYEAEAREHGETAAIYQSSQAIYQNEQMFNHCDSLNKSLSKAAEDARALAVAHREMANKAEK